MQPIPSPRAPTSFLCRRLRSQTCYFPCPGTCSPPRSRAAPDGTLSCPCGRRAATWPFRRSSPVASLQKLRRLLLDRTNFSESILPPTPQRTVCCASAPATPTPPCRSPLLPTAPSSPSLALRPLQEAATSRRWNPEGEDLRHRCSPASACCARMTSQWLCKENSSRRSGWCRRSPHSVPSARACSRACASCGSSYGPASTLAPPPLPPPSVPSC